jgi:quercetin dioxygenase-like cupin family protein
MRKISILAVGIVVFAAANVSAQQKIVRKELYKADIGVQPISTVDVREIVLQPNQITGRHRHPCPVISYVVEGTIRFQVRGQKMHVIHAGQVCYEPACAVIEHFDNASDHAPARFIPYYLLNGQKELIEMLPTTQTKPQ